MVYVYYGMVYVVWFAVVCGAISVRKRLNKNSFVGHMRFSICVK